MILQPDLFKENVYFSNIYLKVFFTDVQTGIETDLSVD